MYYFLSFPSSFSLCPLVDLCDGMDRWMCLKLWPTRQFGGRLWGGLFATSYPVAKMGGAKDTFPSSLLVREVHFRSSNHEGESVSLF